MKEKTFSPKKIYLRLEHIDETLISINKKLDGEERSRQSAKRIAVAAMIVSVVSAIGFVVTVVI